MPRPDDAAVASTTLTGVTVDGNSVGNVKLQFGVTGLTQYADSNGNSQVNALHAERHSAGASWSGVPVIRRATSSPTIRTARASIDRRRSPSPASTSMAACKQLDGGPSPDRESGPPILSATGKIVGSSLEGSNTDIADEFSKLIVTQQAYSANTRIVTTGNQMIQDLLNMMR